MREGIGIRIAAARTAWANIRGRLFGSMSRCWPRSYARCWPPMASFGSRFSYQDQKTSLVRIQREQASGAAAKIGQFIREIEGQLGWMTQLPWAAVRLEQRRFDALRLLRQVPAIAELVRARRRRPRAAAGVENGARCGRQRHRSLQRAGVPRSQGAQDLLRSGLSASRNPSPT